MMGPDGSSTARNGLFRKSAVDHKSAGAKADPMLRIPNRWPKWGFWSLLLSISVALASSLMIEVNRTLTAPVEIASGGEVTAVVPAELGQSITAGMKGTVSWDGHESDATIASVSKQPTVADEVVAELDLSGDRTMTGASGVLHLSIRDEPLLVFLVPDLAPLL